MLMQAYGVGEVLDVAVKLRECPSSKNPKGITGSLS